MIKFLAAVLALGALSVPAFAHQAPIRCEVNGKVDGELRGAPLIATYDKEDAEWLFRLTSPGGNFDFQVRYTTKPASVHLQMLIDRNVDGKIVSTALNSNSKSVDLYSGDAYDYYNLRCE